MKYSGVPTDKSRDTAASNHVESLGSVSPVGGSDVVGHVGKKNFSLISLGSIPLDVDQVESFKTNKAYTINLQENANVQEDKVLLAFQEEAKKPVFRRRLIYCFEVSVLVIICLVLGFVFLKNEDNKGDDTVEVIEDVDPFQARVDELVELCANVEDVDDVVSFCFDELLVVECNNNQLNFVLGEIVFAQCRSCPCEPTQFFKDTLCPSGEDPCFDS